MVNSNGFLARTGWRGRGLDFLIGALAILGHAPFHLWPLTIAAFVYLFWRLDATSAGNFRCGFGRGFWFALGLFTASVYWIASAFAARGPEFIWLAPPMVLGLAVIMAMIWALAGGLFTRFDPDSLAKPFYFASLFFLAEFVRGHAFGGFPWNLPGYIFKAGGAFSQAASVGGIYGLSLLVLLTSALLAFSKRSKRGLITLAGAGLILAVQFGYGAVRLSQAQPQFVEGPVLRIVQVQFDQKDKFDPDKSIDVVNKFLTETIAPGIENVTHIIWPEGAVSGIAIENAELIRVMGEILANNSSEPPLWLLNSLRFVPDDNAPSGYRGYYYNTVATIRFDDEGRAELIDYNDKMRLVPFGEFIPLEKLIKSYGPQTISTSLASISAAPKKTTSLIPGLPRVSPQICYEIVFQGLTPRTDGPNDPKWILNQTNDAWFGNSLGPRQHANIAQYRAIEEGLPVVRAASNGISGAIDPYGRFVVKVNIGQTQALDFHLPQPINKPLFFAGAKWFLLLINFIVCIICILRSRQGKRKRHKHIVQ